MASKTVTRSTDECFLSKLHRVGILFNSPTSLEIWMTEHYFKVAVIRERSTVKQSNDNCSRIVIYMWCSIFYQRIIVTNTDMEFILFVFKLKHENRLAILISTCQALRIKPDQQDRNSRLSQTLKVSKLNSLWPFTVPFQYTDMISKF